MIINTYFKQVALNPTYVLFSATVDDQTIKDAEVYINQPTPSV